MSRNKIFAVLAIFTIVLIQILVMVLATAERGYMAVGGEFGVILFGIGLYEIKRCLKNEE